MFDKEIIEIENEILALKQQKLKSITQLKTTETRIPLNFVLQEVSGDNLTSQTFRIVFSPKNNVKPLISWYIDRDSVSSGRLYNSSLYSDFDLPPDFKFTCTLELRISALKSSGDYAGETISDTLVLVSTSELDYSISEA